MGYKVSKELAIDCLVQVANENLYDPVREYLEWCANTTDPDIHRPPIHRIPTPR
jgi:predicted P-loop ATPase